MANDRQQRAARAEQMRKDREKADRRQRNVITIAIVGVVIVLVAVAGVAVASISGQKADDTALNVPANTGDDYSITYDTAAAGGTAAADAKPVEVELYEDFQCPACRSFEAASGDFLKDQVKSGAITIVYKPYSLLDQASSNKYSSRATNVALCALDSGGVADYVKLHDYLYLNQPEENTAGPEDPELIKAAEGLGITGIQSCVDKNRFSRWIEDAREAGTKAGVQSTPTVKVAGKVVQNPTPQGLQAAITAAA